MPALLTRDGLNFLYRRDEGLVDRKTWWMGMILLASILFILTMIWLILRPWAGRGLDERALIDAKTMAAYVFLAIYVFAAFIIAVSYMNLSAKRFRAKGWQGARPLGLAAAPLLLLLLFGSVFWLQMRVVDAVPSFIIPTTGLLCAGAFAWHIFELGLRSDSPD